MVKQRVSTGKTKTSPGVGTRQGMPASASDFFWLSVAETVGNFFWLLLWF
jgi:hypothetical protein